MGLRVVCMGTGEFALPTFRSLIEGNEHEVVGVYTQPDRTGRGHHRHVNSVKELAIEHNVPVFQPPRVNTAESLDELRSLQADVILVAAYGQILSRKLLDIPPLGTFNLHGSLLPKHRGAAPVQYSVWRGDRVTGVTMFRIVPALDAGPIIGHVETKIHAEETSGELMMRLADLSIELTQTALQQLEAGTAVLTPQNDADATLAPKIAKEAGTINWDQSADEIDCHIRAMQPWPKAVGWLHLDGRKPLRCIFLKAAVRPDQQSGRHVAGTMWRDDREVFVATGDGVLQLKLIQPEGKKPMNPEDLFNGYGIQDTACFHSTAESA